VTMLTEESNPRTTALDSYSALEIVTAMNAEDATVATAVRGALPRIAQAVDAIVERLRAGGRMIYVGAGTSGRLGVLDAVECVPTFSVEPGLVIGLIAGGEIALTQAVEGAEDDRDAGKRDLEAVNAGERDAVVGIAASGRTPYVLGALDYANTIGALTVAISCNDPAPMLDLAQIAIPVVVGPEVLAGSTRLKAGTAQKMVLNMLSTAAMVRLGKVYGNLMVDVKVTNQKLSERAQRIVCRVTGVDQAEAARLLTLTQYEVKPAIVMAVRGVSVDEARALLRAANGMLRDVIG
jgi:N-acetylmuramic acid 6-phosphate etherase